MKTWIGPKLMVFLVDPRDIELILGSHVYIDKASEYRFFKPWLGNGLLISTGILAPFLRIRFAISFFHFFFKGSKWRSHRKLIAPTFHLNVLKSFIDLFNENSRLVVNKMKTEGKKTFDAHDYMSECTVEILLGKLRCKNINLCNRYGKRTISKKTGLNTCTFFAIKQCKIKNLQLLQQVFHYALDCDPLMANS